MTKCRLHIGALPYRAMIYAVKNWHYSGTKTGFLRHGVFGIWEDARFVGVIIYGQGATEGIGSPFGLTLQQTRELTRIALQAHSVPVSRLISITLKKLKKAYPAIQLVVSFADTKQNHHGGIYQASNWIYLGIREAQSGYFRIHGQVLHSRSVHSRYKGGSQSLLYLRKYIDPKAEVVAMSPKHKYVYAFDSDLRKRLSALAQPYPKRAESIDNDAPAFQAGEGGVIPTSALHK